MFELSEWRPLYDVWTERTEPPEPADLVGKMPDWTQDYRLVNRHETEPWWSLWLVDETDAPLVQIEHSQARWDRTTDLDGDTEEELELLLDAARSHYTLYIRGDSDNAVHGVQVALALGLAVLGNRQGVLHDVSALRMLTKSTLERVLEADDFAIEDHVTLHLVTEEESRRAWLHSHGMEKFGRSNLETFDLEVTLGRDAGKLVNELMLSSALGSRHLVGEVFELPAGRITVRPSNEIRPGVLTIPLHELEGHDLPYLCVVDAEDFGDISGAVDGYLHRSLVGVGDWAEEQETTRRLLPLVRNHFSENSTSDDFEYYARIPLDVQAGETTTSESVWVRITRWLDRSLRGTLASDSMVDSRLQVGTEVEFQSEDIEAIMLSVSGKPVGGQHLKNILEAEAAPWTEP